MRMLTTLMTLTQKRGLLVGQGVSLKRFGEYFTLRKCFSSGSPVDEVGAKCELTLVREESGVRRITLNNPKKRNALSLAMLESLSGHLKNSPDLRVVVIDANGPAFSGGHDLKELTGSSGAQYHRKVFDFCSQVMLSIRSLPVPVIATVNGIAAAAGCQLAASCDITIATEDSHFSTPGANVGLFCSTPGIAVSRTANTKMAAYMLLTGNSITAQEALSSGLITRVVSGKEEMDAETNRCVKAICGKSKSVIAMGKTFFYRQLEESITRAYSEGSCVMVDNLSLQDAQEGIDAFIHKRTPGWTHSETKKKE